MKRASLMLAITLTGLACVGVVNAVRIEPGAAPSKPVFVITDTTGRGPAGTIYGLSVVPCGRDEPIWQLVATGASGSPTHVTYGETPPGYVARIGPDSLTAGCYDVFVSDSRRVRFRVDGAGRVTAGAR